MFVLVCCLSILDHTMAKSQKQCGDWTAALFFATRWQIGSWVHDWLEAPGGHHLQRFIISSRWVQINNDKIIFISSSNLSSPLISILVTACKAHSCTKPNKMHIAAPSAASQLPKRFVDSWSCKAKHSWWVASKKKHHPIPKYHMIPNDYDLAWDHIK